MEAIVNFRTEANGSFRFMRGLTRGYWRMLVVKDPEGSTSVSSNNVVSQSVTHSGLRGVTKRSAYWIGDNLAHCEDLADAYNTKRDAICAACAPWFE